MKLNNNLLLEQIIQDSLFGSVNTESDVEYDTDSIMIEKWIGTKLDNKQHQFAYKINDISEIILRNNLGLSYSDIIGFTVRGVFKQINSYKKELRKIKRKIKFLIKIEKLSNQDDIDFNQKKYDRKIKRFSKRIQNRTDDIEDTATDIQNLSDKSLEDINKKLDKLQACIDKIECEDLTTDSIVDNPDLLNNLSDTDISDKIYSQIEQLMSRIVKLTDRSAKNVAQKIDKMSRATENLKELTELFSLYKNSEKLVDSLQSATSMADYLKKKPTDPEVLDKIQQDKTFGSTSKYAQGKYVYIHRSNLLRQIDVAIIPLNKSVYGEINRLRSEIKRLSPKSSADIGQMYTITIDDIILKDGNIITSKILQSIANSGATGGTAYNLLSKKFYTDTEEQTSREKLFDKLGLKDQKTLDNLFWTHPAFMQQSDEMVILADKNIQHVGKSKYISINAYLDPDTPGSPYHQANSLTKRLNDIKRSQGMIITNEQKEKSGIDFFKNYSTTDDDIPITVTSSYTDIAPDTGSLIAFDNSYLTITGTMGGGDMTIMPNTTNIDKDWEDVTDEKLVDEINALNDYLKYFFNKQIIGKILNPASIMPYVEGKPSYLDHIFGPVKSWGVGFKWGEWPFNKLPIGIEFGDREEAAVKLWNIVWSKYVQDYNNFEKNASDDARFNLVTSVNAAIVTKFSDWLKANISAGKQGTFKCKLLQCSNMTDDPSFPYGSYYVSSNVTQVTWNYM